MPLLGLFPAEELLPSLPLTHYPDSFPQPWFQVAQQQATTNVSPLPQPNQFPIQPTFPDRIVLGVFEHVSQQQAVTTLSPQPERTSPLTAVVFPDRIDRPLFLAPWQQAFASNTKPEEKIQLDWSPTFPDRVLRSTLPVSAFPFFGSPIQSERTSTLSSVVYPDRLDPAPYPIANRFTVTTIPPKPEEKIQLDWSPTFPDRVLRAMQPVTLHHVFSMWVIPIPDVPISFVSFPERIERPRFLAHQQSFLVFTPPQFPTPFFKATYPDHIDQAGFHSELQQAFAFVALQASTPSFPTAVVFSPSGSPFVQPVFDFGSSGKDSAKFATADLEAKEVQTQDGNPAAFSSNVNAPNVSSSEITPAKILDAETQPAVHSTGEQSAPTHSTQGTSTVVQTTEIVPTTLTTKKD